MKRVHLVVGVAGVVAFLLTGQYMDRALGHMVGEFVAESEAEAVRPGVVGDDVDAGKFRLFPAVA